MKKSILTLIGSVLLLAPCLPGRAQEAIPELLSFREAAGDHSILFRGRQAPRYLFPANGHPYWYHPDFERGDLVFEGNYYPNVSLNIDALSQQVLVHLEGSTFAVALSPELTPHFSIGERNFEGKGPGEDLPEGIYEVFGEGPERVYKHIWKVISFSVSNMNGKGIGYYDDNYREKLTRYFAYHQAYYFRDADGHFSRIGNRGSLLGKFPERKKEIRKALRAERIGGSRDAFDDFCKAVLNITAR